MLLGNAAVMVARLFSTVILTRLLTAADYGVAGIVWLLTYIFVMLSDVGFYPYVMRHPNPDSKFLDEVWTLRLLRGLALTLLMILASEPLAWYLNKPELRDVIIIASFTMVLDGLASMAFVTAPREGNVHRVTILDVVPQIISIIVSIVLAYFLRSYWALIYAVFVTSTLKIILSYALFPQPWRRLRFSREQASKLWQFGRYVSGSSILEIFVGQTDRILLARLFTVPQFGIYSLAYNLAQIPHAVTGKFATHIVMPILSRAARSESGDIGKVYYEAGLSYRLLYMFAVGGFIACAPFIVDLLYDDRYASAAFYLQLLAIVALFYLPVAIASEALVASGRVSQYLRLNLLRFAWLVASGTAFFFLYGAVGIVYALVSTRIFGQIYSWWCLHRAGILKPSKEARFLAAAAVGFLLGAIVNNVGLRLLA